MWLQLILFTSHWATIFIYIPDLKLFFRDLKESIKYYTLNIMFKLLDGSHTWSKILLNFEFLRFVHKHITNCTEHI